MSDDLSSNEQDQAVSSPESAETDDDGEKAADPMRPPDLLERLARMTQDGRPIPPEEFRKVLEGASDEE